MCGLAGYISHDNSQSDIMPMLQAISHRGPDDTGFISVDQNIFLGHTRLSIQDLSTAGHQPMYSISQRYVIVFNGEIYNHLSLRSELEELETFSWNGHSDTETLLAGFDVWGISETLKKCVGMFAFAVWDSFNEHLILARDRFGEKPLYYGKQNSVFMFSSELKALKAHSSFENIVNRQALAYYFKLNFVPTPFSIYEGIFKLEPSTIATFSKDGNFLNSEKFWDLEAISLNPKINNRNEENLVNELDSIIRNSIKEQQISDVPIGALLSGGVDSSCVVGILQSISNKPVKTFTIGFENENYNEAGDAVEVSKYLRTDHSELIVTAEQALNVISKLSFIYDEPFADASQIPTYLVSQLAKQDVSVVLSGDGGDELFCGYNRYLYTKKLWSTLKFFPQFFRKFISQILMILSPDTWDCLAKFLFLDKKIIHFGNKLQKSAIALQSSSFFDLYSRLISNWQDDDCLVKGFKVNSIPLLSNSKDIELLSDLEKMMLWDKQSYLTDDILVKMDRASMACSLEGRVPLLDYRIAEFASTLPLDFKYRHGQGKWILRQVLYKYVPKNLIEKPKKGFSLPISEWLRGPLKNWAENLLEPSRLDEEGFLHSGLVKKKWDEHLSCKRDWSVQLWSVLMFQLWLEKNQ